MKYLGIGSTYNKWCKKAYPTGTMSPFGEVGGVGFGPLRPSATSPKWKKIWGKSSFRSYLSDGCLFNLEQMVQIASPNTALSYLGSTGCYAKVGGAV